jgi:enterochelin esterase-like enzyme
MDAFVKDFEQDLRPFVEQRYRVSNARQDRAIAGLSMGGAQTLNIAFAHLGDYGYIGVFSSGIFGIDRGGPDGGPGEAWSAQYRGSLENAELRKGLRLVWFATGSDDFLLATSRGTVDALRKFGLEVSFKETEGGHTWLNWRDYLHEFAQQLFR